MPRTEQDASANPHCQIAFRTGVPNYKIGKSCMVAEVTPWLLQFPCEAHEVVPSLFHVRTQGTVAQEEQRGEASM